MSEASRCPQCGSDRLYKDGLRYRADKSTTQRWLCRNCGYRFSEKRPLQNVLSGSINTTPALPFKRQVCELLTEESKNLTTVETRQEQAQREGTTQTADVKGKIVQLLWELEKDGKKPGTIRNYSKYLNHLLRNGVNLLDPEHVKSFLAKSPLRESTKATIVGICSTWFEYLKIAWKPPKYDAVHEIPFIPTEQELDQLIAASGKKVAAFLQLLKETGARCGEITKLTWTDIDFQQKVVRIKAEKGSMPRMAPISTKAMEMLNNLPKTSDRIFVFADDMRSNFYVQRKCIARKLGNPRLMQIHFHTFRHWKGTMEYHKTKDVFYVKEILGHKSIQSTQIYIHIDRALFHDLPPEEFHVRVAKTEEEIKCLLEAGFEYVLQKDNIAYFRKRK
ncbi:MAG: tyrosine-type recombinase/integrase [Candidatus Bathycorpusculaceae bacterium]